MNTWRKTVLLFQPSKFQATIWRSILASQNIDVIWQVSSGDEKQIINYGRSLESSPDVILIDLKLDNAYELCYWCDRYCPNSKIVLTVDSTNNYSPVIRRWAVNQGVEELLINFQQQNLLSSAMNNVNCVLKLLDCQPAQRETIVRALRSLAPKFIASSQITLHPNKSFTPRKEKRARGFSVSPMMGYLLVAIVSTLLVVTIALDAAILWLIFPVKEIGSQISIQLQKLEQSIRTESALLKKSEHEPKGIFNYGGSTAWAPIRKLIDPKIEAQYSQFDLRYLPAINATPGSGTGIRMLLEGKLDFAQSSRFIAPEEHIFAHQQGFSLKQYNVAIDAIAIAVNPSLSISGLTIEQVRKIYRGQITNWNEVGGPDLSIVPFSRKREDGGAVNFFQNHILQDQPFGRNIKYVYSTTDGLRQINKTPGGIYYGSAPAVVPQCTVKSLSIANENGVFIPPYRPPIVPHYRCPQIRNQLNIAAIKNATYPITYYLSTIVKQDGGRAEQAGEAYTKLLLTAEMQQLIKDAGFIPIN